MEKIRFCKSRDPLLREKVAQFIFEKTSGLEGGATIYEISKEFNIHFVTAKKILLALEQSDEFGLAVDRYIKISDKLETERVTWQYLC